MTQYHISPKGEVGACEALTRCPYGNFENEHYTTEVEARRAYEAAMRGETFVPGLTKNEESLTSSRDFDGFREKKLKKLEKLIEKGAIEPVTQDVQNGMFLDLSQFQSAYKEMLKSKAERSEELARTRRLRQAISQSRGSNMNVNIKSVATPDLWGGKLVRVRRDNANKVIIATIETNGQLTKAEIPMGEDGEPLTEGMAWTNSLNTEEAATRAAQVREFNAKAASELILPDLKRSFTGTIGRKILGESRFTVTGADPNDPEGVQNVLWNPKLRMAEAARTYCDYVKDAEKAGSANPQQFAMERFKSQLAPKYDVLGLDNRPYDGNLVAGNLLIKILEQDDEYKPSPYDRAILESSFDPGERPFLDYSFKDLGLKKEA